MATELMDGPKGAADIGRDGGGIYRHIARTVTAVDYSECIESPYTWCDVLRAVLAKMKDNPHIEFRIFLADSVVLYQGRICEYVYSDEYDRSRVTYVTNPNSIIDKFIKIHGMFSKAPEYMAVLHVDNKEPIPLTLVELQTTLGGRLPDQAVLQCFVPSKSNSNECRTFRTNYWLDSNQKVFMKTDRLIVSADVMGSKKDKGKSNMSREKNKAMEDTTLLIVQEIQQRSKSRIIKLDADFCQDSTGKLWLIRTCNCVGMAAAPAKRSTSPEQFKYNRTAGIVDMDEGLALDTSMTRTSLSRSKIGRHSDERVLSRSMSRPILDEDSIDDICVAIDDKRAKSRGHSVSPSRRSKSPEKIVHQDIMGKVQNVPGVRLGPEIRHAMGGKTEIFGSTQLGGCQGDFCNFDSKYLENEEDNGIESRQKLSMFRKKLLSLDGPRADNVSINEEINSMIKSDPNELRTDVKADQIISLRSIIQARKEMPLVKLQLSRIRRGEKGDYVSQDTYGDIMIGTNLPAHYYHDVSCCSNCFKVYSIIERARLKAMSKIHKPQQTVGQQLLATNKSIYSQQLDGTSMSSVPIAQQEVGLEVALQAIDGLTKLDIAEIRSLPKPPAAVEVVVEAVTGLLLGKALPFADARRLLSGGEAFLNMLKSFKLEDVSDAKLKLVEPYVDNPLFRPENVVSVSKCASKFCAWVIGVVQAARWQQGIGHRRTDLLSSNSLNQSSLSSIDEGLNSYNSNSSSNRQQGGSGIVSSKNGLTKEAELNFVQKLEQKRALAEKKKEDNKDPSTSGSLQKPEKAPARSSLDSSSVEEKKAREIFSRSFDNLKPQVQSGGTVETQEKNARERNALAKNQKKASDRLSSLNSEGPPIGGTGKDYRCRDGITKMPYTVLGTMTPTPTRCNFVIIHDFFDTCDATAILMKPLIQRHSGCQILCFNYPGQANTVWPRPLAAERERGAPEVIFNNDWMADRVHELMQYVESQGDMLFAVPFHLVGFGNGAAIAAAFTRKWGNKPYYKNSIKSFVSINGFLYPDPQLSSVLHSATQIFESAPHNRPDIPISYWSRFLFSEDYLRRVNPNLALNIYTAVSNPITNEGRSKLTRGCMQHVDLRGALAPDQNIKKISQTNAHGEYDQAPSQIPVILLQSTENFLVNASNIDPFLMGRNAKHLWSHQLNILSEAQLAGVHDIQATWVGRMSRSNEDYTKYSILGRNGLKMLSETMTNPRGAFVLWIRAGHAVIQENKPAVLDLMDALACPTEDYYGLNLAVNETTTLNAMTSYAASSKAGSGLNMSNIIPDEVKPDNKKTVKQLDVLFSLDGTASKAQPVAVEVDIDKTVGSKPSTTSSNIRSHEEKAEDPVKGVAEFSFTIDQAPSTLKNGEEGEEEEVVEIASPVKSNQMKPKESYDETKSSKEAALFAKPIKQNFETESKVDVHTSSSGMSKAQEILEISKKIERPVAQMNVVVGEEDEKNKLFEELKVALEDPNPSPKSKPVRTRGKDKKAEKGEEEDTYPVIPTVAETLPLIDTDEAIATREQRTKKTWVVDKVSEQGKADAATLELELAKKQKEYAELMAKIEAEKEQKKQEAYQQGVVQAQGERLETFKEEDKKLLTQLEKEMADRKKQRQAEDKARRVEYQVATNHLVETGVIPPSESSDRQPITEMDPMNYNKPAELPRYVTDAKDFDSEMDAMLRDEKEMAKRGNMSMDDYEKVKRQMAQRQFERDQKLRHLASDEQEELYVMCAKVIQRIGRGYNGRKRHKKFDLLRKQKRKMEKKVIKAQSFCRGFVARRRVKRIRYMHQMAIARAQCILLIQCVIRGFIARRYVGRVRRHHNARHIQRHFRGHLGRIAARRERYRLNILKKKQIAAGKIQSTWRMKVAREEFRSLRVHMLAAIELQRAFRGFLARKQVRRKRKWEAAVPGPERIKLGLEMIEETKLAFEKQQEEIDALHRAQERAEARVSHIYGELRESEKELKVLERELQEIDQIERDLQTLTHERDLLLNNVSDATGLPRTAAMGKDTLVKGVASNFKNDPDAERRRKAEAYALEMTIQIKRAEREKKRQELETEFAAVFQEVEKKKKALIKLEGSLADMESTRERKDREFRRLQQNLMTLLLEQKKELDDLREKGIELESATAATAAAATATAMKAKEHEKRSTAMFSQTEELMKFQFMSMSLSYFSSLNMLKQLRDMNADTTTAAITSSAEAAAAAAAASTAANLPSVKKLNLGAGDFVEASIQKKKQELELSQKAEKDLKQVLANPLPENIRMWTISDVSKWLETLFLGKYVPSFREAAIDGPFLLELREEDLIQVLGVTHKLHVRKIIIGREKLKPINEQERSIFEEVKVEEKAVAVRKKVGVPDLDTVFSQARNGRLKRLEESLNLNFPIDSEDERGNTLLIISCQNNNRKMVEMLLLRGCNVNHQNTSGNTALHFAMAFDPDGNMGEYLIEHGADDTIENVERMTCYDGLAA